MSATTTKKPTAKKPTAKPVRLALPKAKVVALKTPAKPVKLATPKAAAPKPVSTPVEPKAKAATFASRCRALIAAGLSNEEIWKTIQPEFNSPDKCRSHVAWHRADIRRRAEGGGRHTSRYDETLTWFLDNHATASAVVNATGSSFEIALLAKAMGRPPEDVLRDLRAKAEARV